MLAMHVACLGGTPKYTVTLEFALAFENFGGAGGRSFSKSKKISRHVPQSTLSPKFTVAFGESGQPILFQIKKVLPPAPPNQGQIFFDSKKDLPPALPKVQSKHKGDNVLWRAWVVDPF